VAIASGLQLWANLSKLHKMMYPRCLDTKGDRVTIPAPDGLAAWCGPIAMNTPGNRKRHCKNTGKGTFVEHKS